MVKKINKKPKPDNTSSRPPATLPKPPIQKGKEHNND